MGKKSTAGMNKLLKAEVAKYRKWVTKKGFFRDRYSLISYYNRRKKIISVGGIYYIAVGKKKYRLNEVEEAFNS